VEAVRNWGDERGVETALWSGTVFSFTVPRRGRFPA
jgi:hypothetical protein